MMLTDVAEKSGWLYSEWKLTYPVGWRQILNAAYALYDTFSDPEILIDGEPRPVSGRQEIVSIEEAGTLMIRGTSGILHVPVMISFLNQTAAVRAVVAAATEEFRNCGYRSFNLSMCQFMDSVELAMFGRQPTKRSSPVPQLLTQSGRVHKKFTIIHA
jgi:hypothetical protein